MAVDTQPTHDEISRFEMPKVRIGAPIVWYRDGTPTRRHAMIGWVTRIGNNTISIHLATGHNRESVKHTTDPRLRLSGDQREDGAWDYTEDYLLGEDVQNLKEIVEKAKIPALAKLHEKIGSLEKALQKLEAKLAELEPVGN